jgi:putative membrane protein
VASKDPPAIDYRFTLANERTFLSWIRTALALLAGGIAAAKALNFEHETWRWLVATPPIVAGALLAAEAPSRWRRYEQAMREGRPLPVGHGRDRGRPCGLRRPGAGSRSARRVMIDESRTGMTPA